MKDNVVPTAASGTVTVSCQWSGAVDVIATPLAHDSPPKSPRRYSVSLLSKFVDGYNAEMVSVESAAANAARARTAVTAATRAICC